MSSSFSNLKLRFAAETTIRLFLERYEGECAFWTFTFEDADTTEKQAYESFNRFTQYLSRRRGEYVVVWERQERGALHAHTIVNIFLDWHELQPKLIDWGFGEIVWVRKCERKHGSWGPLAAYLTFYLMSEVSKKNTVNGGQCLAGFGASAAFLGFHGSILRLTTTLSGLRSGTS